jgi:hypothetical protein
MTFFIQLFLAIYLSIMPSKALLLEDQNEYTTFKNKRIGYCECSADSQSVVSTLLDTNQFDYNYIVVYPLWGLFISPEDVNANIEKLVETFKDNSKVFATRYSPEEIQRVLANAKPSQVFYILCKMSG